MARFAANKRKNTLIPHTKPGHTMGKTGHRPGRKRALKGFLIEKRPRKTQSDRAQEGRAAIAKQPHRRALPDALRLSEKAVTELGRLNLRRFISDEQHEAGQRFQVCVLEYQQSIGSPDTGGRGGPGFPCAGAINCDPCACKQRKEAFNAATNALLEAGHRVASAVSHVVVHDEALPPPGRRFDERVELLKLGLAALVRHFGLDGRKRRAA
jgi:hypothetical protein